MPLLLPHPATHQYARRFVRGGRGGRMEADLAEINADSMDADLLGRTTERGEALGDVAALDEEALAFGEQALEHLAAPRVAVRHRIVPSVEGRDLGDPRASRELEDVGSRVAEMDVEHACLVTPDHSAERDRRPQAPEPGQAGEPDAGFALSLEFRLDV